MIMIITYVCDAFQIQNIYILLDPVNSSLMVLIVWWNRAFAPKKVLDEHGDEVSFILSLLANIRKSS